MKHATLTAILGIAAITAPFVQYVPSTHLASKTVNGEFVFFPPNTISISTEHLNYYELTGIDAVTFTKNKRTYVLSIRCETCDLSAHDIELLATVLRQPDVSHEKLMALNSKLDSSILTEQVPDNGPALL